MNDWTLGIACQECRCINTGDTGSNLNRIRVSGKTLAESDALAEQIIREHDAYPRVINELKRIDRKALETPPKKP